MRILIAFVDKWAAVDEPSQLGRIAQSRALVRLGLVDRAWARLQELAESDTAAIEVLILTTELFLARQWTKRARTTLERGLVRFPDHSALQVLWDRLSEPATEPDLAGLADDCNDVSTLITAAHHLIATGTHTKARHLLDRAARIAPDNERVSDMLWGLDGDFSLDTPLAELVRVHGPELLPLANFDDDPEHTESASPEDLRATEDREVEPGNFPALFRNQEPQTEFLPEGFLDEQEEVTKISSMVNLSNLDTLTDATESEPEHTEIQRVIRHDPEESQPPTDSVFRLSGLNSDLETPELEDEDVIVRVHGDQEKTESPGLVSDVEHGVVIEPEPTSPPVTRLQPDESAKWAAPIDEMEIDHEAETKITADPMAIPTPRPPPNRRSSGLSWWFAALGVVFLLACTLLGASMLLQLL